MCNYIDINKREFDEKFTKNWGSIYPESSVIRLYELFYKNLLGLDSKSKKLLDFGCARGVHSKYFLDKGFDVYGVDISNNAIDYCREYFGSNKFKVLDIINDDIDIYEVFGCRFDVIFANHVLYYFNDLDLDNIMNKFNNVLNDGGVVIFTMMTTKCYFYKFIDFSYISSYGLNKVSLRGNTNDDTFINFINNEVDLRYKFRLFEELYIGKYDFYAPEGSTEHFYYIGKKIK